MPGFQSRVPGVPSLSRDVVRPSIRLACRRVISRGVAAKHMAIGQAMLMVRNVAVEDESGLLSSKLDDERSAGEQIWQK